MKNYKNYLATLAILIAGSFIFGACEGDDVNPDAQIPFSFGLKETSTSNTNARIQSSHLSFSGGHALISSISFEAESVHDVDSLDIEFELEKIIKADLSNLTEPDYVANIPPGEYEEVEIEVEIKDTENEPGILFEGTFTNADGKEIPIKFDYRDGFEFEIEGEAADGQAIVLKSAEDPLAQITFDAQAWFSDVTHDDLEQAQLDSNNVLLITENFNTYIYDKVVNRMGEAEEAVFQ